MTTRVEITHVTTISVQNCMNIRVEVFVILYANCSTKLLLLFNDNFKLCDIFEKMTFIFSNSHPTPGTRNTNSSHKVSNQNKGPKKQIV